jgi:hypothetical protein
MYWLMFVLHLVVWIVAAIVLCIIRCRRPQTHGDPAVSLHINYCFLYTQFVLLSIVALTHILLSLYYTLNLGNDARNTFSDATAAILFSAVPFAVVFVLWAMIFYEWQRMAISAAVGFGTRRTRLADKAASTEGRSTAAGADAAAGAAIGGGLGLNDAGGAAPVSPEGPSPDKYRVGNSSLTPRQLETVADELRPWFWFMLVSAAFAALGAILCIIAEDALITVGVVIILIDAIFWCVWFLLDGCCTIRKHRNQVIDMAGGHESALARNAPVPERVRITRYWYFVCVPLVVCYVIAAILWLLWIIVDDPAPSVRVDSCTYTPWYAFFVFLMLCLVVWLWYTKPHGSVTDIEAEEIELDDLEKAAEKEDEEDVKVQEEEPVDDDDKPWDAPIESSGDDDDKPWDAPMDDKPAASSAQTDNVMLEEAEEKKHDEEEEEEDEEEETHTIAPVIDNEHEAEDSDETEEDSHIFTASSDSREAYDDEQNRSEGDDDIFKSDDADKVVVSAPVSAVAAAPAVAAARRSSVTHGTCFQCGYAKNDGDWVACAVCDAKRPEAASAADLATMHTESKVSAKSFNKMSFDEPAADSDADAESDSEAELEADLKAGNVFAIAAAPEKYSRAELLAAVDTGSSFNGFAGKSAPLDLFLFVEPNDEDQKLSLYWCAGGSREKNADQSCELSELLLLPVPKSQFEADCGAAQANPEACFAIQPTHSQNLTIEAADRNQAQLWVTALKVLAVAE